MNKRTIGYIIGGVLLILFVLFLLEITKQPKINIQNDDSLDAPIISEEDAAIGTEDPTVTIVHFGYVGCEFCKDIQTILLNLQKEFPEDIKIVWKDYPNDSLFPEATNAALAARCAQEQDAFWEYQTFLFANESTLRDTRYFEIAKELNLNEKKFSSCIKKGRGMELVTSSIEEGNALSITASPTLFINNDRFVGKQTPQNLRNLVVNAIGL